MSWALWLAIPVAVTLLAAVITWLRSRPAKALDTAQAMRAHSDYLDALARGAAYAPQADASESRRPPRG